MRTNCQGASVIEFALVAFIFFLILWGLLELGRTFYVRNTTQHLTRCMAREAVVLKPSEFDLAKQSCLLNASGMYTWPFYRTTPSDLRNAFVIRYYLRNGNYVDEPNNTNYDNQVDACLTGDNRCVTYVQARAAPGSMPEFGLLGTWLQAPGSIAERYAAATMPAESMGYMGP
jgi:hypothetical protein